MAQFDRNGDKRLDAAERKAAREWLATQPAGGFGGGAAAHSAAAARRPPVARPQARASRREGVPRHAPLYDQAAIRTLFLQFEDERLGAGARRIQQHGCRRPGDG